MKITVNRDSDKLTVAVDGTINSLTSAEFGKALDSLPLGETKLLLLDFANVEYISSAGLRVLLSTYDRMDDHGAMKIINVSEDVFQILDITGFIGTLDVERAGKAR